MTNPNPPSRSFSASASASASAAVPVVPLVPAVPLVPIADPELAAFDRIFRALDPASRSDEPPLPPIDI